MDWRYRRYYVVKLPSYMYDEYTKLLKEVPNIKLHPPTYPPRKLDNNNICFNRRFNEEHTSRGYYHFLASVPNNYSLVFLMRLLYSMCRECAENGWVFRWAEVKREYLGGKK